MLPRVRGESRLVVQASELLWKQRAELRAKVFEGQTQKIEDSMVDTCVLGPPNIQALSYWGKKSQIR